MTIDSLTDQQKSLLLAKAVGWEVGTLGDVHWITVDGSELGNAERGRCVMSANLYDPANMALVKKVAEWAYRIDLSGFIMYLEKYAFAILVEEHGFAIMLDRILKMAIEAGLIEVKDA